MSPVHTLRYLVLDELEDGEDFVDDLWEFLVNGDGRSAVPQNEFGMWELSRGLFDVSGELCPEMKTLKKIWLDNKRYFPDDGVVLLYSGD